MAQKVAGGRYPPAPSSAAGHSSLHLWPSVFCSSLVTRRAALRPRDISETVLRLIQKRIAQRV